ncbi:MurR/RpiR family transcriptional regulator [[Mycoplasma] collis]|uniref:MurR/RpiR family transcriptional regulator n=1 Tax=[Mycoplasma] collis TaxID=2127 RepID=UPI00051C992B|nr:MurR/RpiR family transcriptional regulator [[Mycoplasma] collis]
MYLFIDKLKHLTEIEIEILNFINSYEKDEFNLTIKEFANKIFVSVATISRFAKKMDFKNYRQLVVFINKRIIEVKNLNLDKKTFLEEEFLSLLKAQKLAIKNFINEKNFNDIKKAGYVLNNAEKILLFGMGSSAISLNEFSSNMQKIGKNIIFDQNFHILLPLLGTLNNNDAIICLTKDFKNKEILFILKKAKDLNIKIILISPEIKKNFHFYDIKISYTKIYDKNRFFPSSSKVISLIILDFLFNFILNLKSEYKENLKKSFQILNDWITFKK